MSFSITFDYRFDDSGFFDDPEPRRSLDAAAEIWEALIKDEFPDVPAGVEFSVRDPEGGGDRFVRLEAPIDDLLVFVGADDLGGWRELDGLTRVITAGEAGPSASGVSGDALLSRILGSFRGEAVTDYEPFAGYITFNDHPDADWSFDLDGNPPDRIDLLSVAIHELGHVLGFSASDAFNALVGPEGFAGPNARFVNGGAAIPLEADGHVLDGFAGDVVAMDPMDPLGDRKLPSVYDLAILADIGYEIAGFAKVGSRLPLTTESDDTGVFGTTADDLIDGLAGDDLIAGGHGDDTLLGGEGADQLFGQDGRDLLAGGAGADTLVGGPDADSLLGGVDSDLLFGENGDDLLSGGDGVDTVVGGEGEDSLSGGEGEDSLQGDAGADLLAGGAGDDRLKAGDGDDTLNGGPGNDVLWGGPGADRFEIDLGDGRDGIQDFDFAADRVVIGEGFGLRSVAEAMGRISRPFSNVTRLELSASDHVDLLHAPGDSPLRAEHLEVLGGVGNAQPTVTGRQVSEQAGQSISLATLFDWSDPDGASDIVSFAVRDATIGGGRLILDGELQDEDRLIEGIPIADIGRWAFRTGAAGETDEIRLRVVDTAGAASLLAAAQASVPAAEPEPEPELPSTTALEYFARQTAYQKGELHDAFVQLRFPGFAPPASDGYQIVRTFESDDGLFYAVALQAQGKTPVLAIRGTLTGFNATVFFDWIASNSDPQGVGYSEVHGMWAELWDWIRDQDRLSLTGHSQGGAQAQIIAAKAHAASDDAFSLGRIVTFNAAGVDRDVTDDFDPDRAEEVIHYISSGDVVSHAGWAFLPGTVEFYDFDALSPRDTPLALVGAAHSGHWAHPGLGANTDDDPPLRSFISGDGFSTTRSRVTSQQLEDPFYSHLTAAGRFDEEYFLLLNSIARLGGNAALIPGAAGLAPILAATTSALAAALSFRGGTESLRTGLGLVIGAAEATAELLVDGAEYLWQEAVEAFGRLLDLGDAVASALDDLREELEAALRTATRWAEQGLEHVQDWGLAVWRGFSDLKEAALEALYDAPEAMIETLRAWGDASWQAAVELPPAVWAELTGLADAAWEAAVDWGEATLRNIAERGRAAIDTAQAAADAIADAAQSAAAAAAWRVIEGSESFWDWASGLVEVQVVAPAPGFDFATHKTSTAAVLLGGDQTESFELLGGGNLFIASEGGDRLTLGGGDNVIFGVAAGLDGLTVAGFGDTDRIELPGLFLRDDALVVAKGSAILSIDIDGDGIADAQTRLEGNYRLASFRLVQTPDGTQIVYDGNASPEARDDVAPVREDRAVSGDVLTNDSDADGDALSVVSVANTPADPDTTVRGRYGTLTLRPDGSYDFAADRADRLTGTQTAVETFTYVVSDGNGATAEAALAFTIQGADERLRGDDGRDVLRGGGGDDRLWGRGGDDRLNGGRGDDFLNGGAGDDVLLGRAGDNTLVGGGGNDRLVGGGRRDLMGGGGGNDRLVAGGGDDELRGGKGRDTFKSGAGSDVLKFKRGDGRDVVLDFRDGQDVIHIETGARNFRQLEITERRGDVFIDYGRRGDLIRLKNADAEELDAGDFMFG